MIGSKTLGEIRSELRLAFNMTDEELDAWFKERKKLTTGKQATTGSTALETLQLLAEGLAIETRRKPKKSRMARS